MFSFQQCILLIRYYLTTTTIILSVNTIQTTSQAKILPCSCSPGLNHSLSHSHSHSHTQRKRVLLSFITPASTVLTQSRSSLPAINQEEGHTEATISLKEPNENESDFGRQKYWNEFYEEKGEFSWYSPWSDIAPFFMEFVPLPSSTSPSTSPSTSTTEVNLPRVLLPGIGNDSSMVDMYDDGYTHLTAFDYAEEGVECAKKFFGHRLLQKERPNSIPIIHKSNEEQQREQQKQQNDDDDDDDRIIINGVDLKVADARQLPYKTHSFDAILEKGTLDAIYLSGGKDKVRANEYLTMAVDEFTRVTCVGGIVMSISAACADAIQFAFSSRDDEWQVLRDGSFYITDDGFSSNNIDATIFVWKKIK